MLYCSLVLRVSEFFHRVTGMIRIGYFEKETSPVTEMAACSFSKYYMMVCHDLIYRFKKFEVICSSVPRNRKKKLRSSLNNWILNLGSNHIFFTENGNNITKM